MTTTDQDQAQAVNGQAPTPAAVEAPAVEVPCEDCATSAERVMGLFGILAAAVLLAIGTDLVTGGWLSRLVGLGPVKDEAPDAGE